MSIARWIGKAALVTSLFMVAHGDAHALTATRKVADYRSHARRFEVHPEPKRETASRYYIINWRTLRAAAAAFYYSRVAF
jgi:hypothetical protein